MTNDLLKDLVTPCHNAPIMASITESYDNGDTVRIWCSVPTCFETWDFNGKLEKD